MGKGQIMIYKTLLRKLKSEQQEPTKQLGHMIHVIWKDKQFVLH